MKTSPTQRTLERLRRDGWTCQSVEKKKPMPAGRLVFQGRLQRVFTLTTTVDLFGCIDIVAVRPGQILGVQCTGGRNHAARLDKIRAESRMRTWIESGASLEVWTWRQVVTRRKDGTKGRLAWEPRVEVVTLETLNEFEAPF